MNKKVPHTWFSQRMPTSFNSIGSDCTWCMLEYLTTVDLTKIARTAITFADACRTIRGYRDIIIVCIVFGRTGCVIQHMGMTINHLKVAISIVKNSKHITFQCYHNQNDWKLFTQFKNVYKEDMVLQSLHKCSYKVTTVTTRDLNYNGIRRIKHWMHCYQIHFQQLTHISFITSRKTLKYIFCDFSFLLFFLMQTQKRTKKNQLIILQVILKN